MQTGSGAEEMIENRIRLLHSRHHHRLEWSKRHRYLKHQWELVGRFFGRHHEEYVSRDGVDFPEVHSWDIHYDSKHHLTLLTLKCHANIEGLFMQDTYDPDSLKDGFCNIDNLPKYKIEYQPYSETARLYREDVFLEEVLDVKTAYDGHIPIIEFTVVGDIRLEGV